jgi:hypothetical protein
LSNPLVNRRNRRLVVATILAAVGRLRFGGPTPFGGVAQLVERHVRNVEVGGSSPLTSTTKPQLKAYIFGSVKVASLRRARSVRDRSGQRWSMTANDGSWWGLSSR